MLVASFGPEGAMRTGWFGRLASTPKVPVCYGIVVLHQLPQGVLFRRMSEGHALAAVFGGNVLDRNLLQECVENLLLASQNVDLLERHFVDHWFHCEEGKERV